MVTALTQSSPIQSSVQRGAGVTFTFPHLPQRKQNLLQGYTCCCEKTTFYEGCVLDHSARNLSSVKESEETQTLGRHIDKNYDTEHNPNQVCKPSIDGQENEDTDSDNEDAAVGHKATADNEQINKNSKYRRQLIDSMHDWPETQFVLPELTEKHEKDTVAIRRARKKPRAMKYQEHYKQIQNYEKQDDSMLTESTEQGKRGQGKPEK